MARGTAYSGGVTAAQHTFAQVPGVESQRSAFDRSSGLKTAFDAGLLVPIFIDEALPGDTINLKMSSFARMATPLFPVLDNMWMDFFFFAVPNRLVWENWQKFCGEQENPGASTDFTVPVIDLTGAQNDPGEIFDHMGIPSLSTMITLNSLHLRAYNLIWNDWFRDQNLQNAATISTDDAKDPATDYFLRRRGKRHDYFSSCLPFPQKGDPVDLPLGTSAPVISAGAGAAGTPRFFVDGIGDHTMRGIITAADVKFDSTPTNAGDMSWKDPKLVADLTNATAATINSIREAFQVQRILERDARGGSRYTEILRSHFGVISPDSRLQRSEYLGGGSTRINVNPVATTAEQAGHIVGDLAAFVTQAADGIGFVKSFTEHCLLIGLVNVRADITYQQGLDRMWTRQTRFDYYWPSLAHLGEQEVLNKEIYYQSLAADDLVFGYQERFAEYRYKPSRTAGIMRSVHAQTLDAWHLALDFDSLPVLNNIFIEDDPPIDRVIAVPSEPHFIADFFFRSTWARPMPTYSVPGMIDHF